MRTLVLKKNLKSLGILLSCVLIIHTTACEVTLADAMQGDNDRVEGRSETLIFVPNRRLMQTSLAVGRQCKRKEREKINSGQKENGSVKGNQRSKRNKVGKLSTGVKTNKRKKREDAAGEGENGIVKGEKRLEQVKTEVLPGSPKRARIDGACIQQRNNLAKKMWMVRIVLWK